MAKFKFRQYQDDGVEFLLKYMRVIVGHQMRLGKTLICLVALKRIKARTIETTRTLILCPKNAVHVWLEDYAALVDPDEAPIRVHGTPGKRTTLWDNDFVIASLDVLKRDVDYIKKVWDVVIVDEAHKARNRKTANHKALKKLKSEYLFLVTGTPASRGPQDLYGLLHLLKPKLFPSYWRFVNTFCHVDDSPWGKDVYGARNREQLRKILSTLMVRKTRKEVFPQLPPNQRQFIRVTITPEQRKVYDELNDEMMVWLTSGELITTSTILSKLTRLRQLTVVPKIISDTLGWGAGLEYIGEQLSDLPREERHCVIFSPYREALQHTRDYLIQGKLFEYEDIIILQGGMEPDELTSALKKFRDTKGIALCTIKFAQAFSLAPAPMSWFLGYEWDPTENEQAEDRLVDVESQIAVHTHYILNLNTLDEYVLETLNDKVRAVRHIINVPGKLLELLDKTTTIK